MSRNKKQNAAARQQSVFLEHHEQCVDIQMSGPLPNPMAYAAYEQTTPGAGERILHMAEKEQEHRHRMEENVIAAQSEDMCKERSEIQRAQWFALVAALAMLGVGAFLAHLGHPGYGASISGATILGVITAFHKGRRQPQENKAVEKSTAKK